MSYREAKPPVALARHVSCTWVQVIEEAIEHLVVPDACSDVISVDGGAPFIVGPATRAVTHALPAGTTVAGVRFRTASIGLALGMPPEELLDGAAPLADLWGRDSQLVDAIAEAPLARRVALLARVVQMRLANADGDRIVEHAVAWLARNPDGTMGELARELGFSERQVQRRLRSATGYAPKVLQRILRFQRALLDLRDAQPGDLGRIASAAGYADQAHFTRETRELAEVAPSSLIGKPGIVTPSMSEMFKTLGPPRRTLRA